MISIDITKAKDIAHKKRRTSRAEEFKPYDEVIMKQIPGNDYTEAEASRQAIREKYATLQSQIDAAQTADELKALVAALEAK